MKKDLQTNGKKIIIKAGLMQVKKGFLFLC